MIRVVSLVLVLALLGAPVLARAEDAGVPLHLPAPGRGVELGPCLSEADAGCPGVDQAGVLRLPGVPYVGVLEDEERVDATLARRRTAELLATAAQFEAQQAQAERDVALARAVAAESRPAWALVLAVGAGCLVVGLAGGVGLVYAARKL